MSSSSKQSTGLSLSSLVRGMPKSAPSSPRGQSDSKRESRSDYFSFRRRSRVSSNTAPSAIDETEKEKSQEPDSPRPARQQHRKPNNKHWAVPPPLMSPSSTTSTTGSTGTGVTSPTVTAAKQFSAAGKMVSRHGSISSLSFKMPADPQLPQGRPKGKSGRIRDSSPPPERFRSHVAFDSVPAGDATKNNTASVVLNCKHQGYHPTRRSRTFMVGLDDRSYSDYALEYLLAALVDDGDHVICVTVMEKDVRSLESSYREQAKVLMKKVIKKNYEFSDSAINITLEYAVGKLHNTFQRLIHIYQPGMLIVGTRGRSGGIQGLMGSRNSFSKYCLQYSPIPVVVVRPDEQRLKKKNKRKLDPARSSYAKILARSAGGVHEADSDASSSVFELESKLSKDEEAHKVAQAIGLPASFDPTLKPLDIDKYLSHRPAPQTTTSSSSLEVPTKVADTGGGSDVEDASGDEDEDEEEVEGEVEGEVEEIIHVTKQQKERLHMMEMGEAAALLKHEDDDEDDDDDDGENGQAKDNREDTSSQAAGEDDKKG